MSSFWTKYHHYIQNALVDEGACLRADDGVIAFNDENDTIVTWLYKDTVTREWADQLELCLSHLETSAALLGQLDVYRPFTAFLAGTKILASAITDNRVLKRMWGADLTHIPMKEEYARTVLTVDKMEVKNGFDDEDELISAIDRELYSQEPQAIPTNMQTLSILKVLVPGVHRHIVLIWGVLEQFIERATRPFQIAPVMPTIVTARMVVEELILGGYCLTTKKQVTESSPDEVLKWIVKSLLSGQQELLLDKARANDIDHGQHHYLVTLPRIEGVYIVPLKQHEHPILDREPRLAATLINLMLGEPLGRHVNEWAISQQMCSSYLGESAMRAAISKGSVIYKCVKALSHKGDGKAIGARVRETLLMISGSAIGRSSILDYVSDETFSKNGALDHALKVRHVHEGTYVYSGVEEYMMEHTRRRLELGPSSDGKSVVLRWTDMIDEPPERDYYLNEGIMAATINSVDNTVSHRIMMALAREAGVTVSEVYFKLVMFLIQWRVDETMMLVVNALSTLKGDTGKLSPPWADYYDAVGEGDTVSTEVLYNITIQYLLRALEGIEKRTDYKNSLDVGRRVFVIMPIPGENESHANLRGMLVYKESSESFIVLPSAARKYMLQSVNEILELMNEEESAKRTISSPVTTFYTIMHFIDVFIERIKYPTEQIIDFFMKLIKLYRAHKVPGDTEMKLPKILNLLLNGARTQPDLHRFAHDRLFSLGGWRDVQLNWNSHELGYAEILRAHFIFANISSPRDFWLGRTRKTIAPITVVSDDYFVTIEGVGVGMVRVRQRNNLLIAQEQDKLVRLLMNDELEPRGDLTQGSPEYVRAVREGARRVPPDTVVTKLPPVLVVICLNYAYKEVRAEDIVARVTLLKYVLRHFETLCSLYNINTDKRPVVFGVGEAGIELLRPFLLRAFFNRIEPVSGEPIIYRMIEEVWNSSNMTKIELPATAVNSEKLRWLDTPTCSFVFGASDIRLCFLQRNASLYWYWSVLAMYHVTRDYRIGFLEMSATVGDLNDVGSVVVMYVSNSVKKFPPMEATADESVRYLSNRYAVAEYTPVVPDDNEMDAHEVEHFLPVLLWQWIESRGSTSVVPYQRCILWLDFARALFADDDRRTIPFLSYSVKKAGVANTFGTGATDELTQYGIVESRGNGYGLLKVTDTGYFALTSGK